MNKNVYKISCRVNAQCPRGAFLLEMAENAIEKGDSLPVKLVLGDKDNGKWTVCIDEPSMENVGAFLVYIQDDTHENLPDEQVERMLRNGNYDIRITETRGQRLFGTLTADEATDAEDSGSEKQIPAEIMKMIEEKAAAGLDTKAGLEKRVRYMLDNYVDEQLIKRVVAGWRAYNKSSKEPNALYIDPNLEKSRKMGDEGRIAEILRCAANRYGMVFDGEKSVGKNVCAETAAWLLHMPVFMITASRQMTLSTLYGDKTTDNSATEALRSKEAAEYAESSVLLRTGGADRFASMVSDAAKFELLKARAAATNIVLEPSELIDWLQGGGVLILNEMNLCESNLLASFLNPILDGTGFLTVPGRGEIPINPDCVLIGTQNTDYAGTEEQNEATMSRLGFVLFEQPESIREILRTAACAELKRNGCEGTPVEEKWLAQADDFYRQCRTAIEQQYASNAVLNIRGFARALAAVAESAGHARLKRQLQFHVINGCPLTERGALNDILDARVTC